MPPTAYLTTGEFSRAIEMLHRAINGRCDRMDTQLDEQTVKITTIETKLNALTLVDGDNKMSTRKNATGWSAGVAGVIIGAVELIKALSN